MSVQKHTKNPFFSLQQRKRVKQRNVNRTKEEIVLSFLFPFVAIIAFKKIRNKRIIGWYSLTITKNEYAQYDLYSTNRT